MNDQTIRIKHRRSDTFARIPHDLLEDENLSASAKGVLCYLLSKPDSWMSRVSDIVNHMKDGKFAIRSALNELRSAGYAHFEQRRDGRGRLSQGEWSIADEPIFPKKSPRTNFRYTDNQDTENRYLSKNEGSKKDSSKKDSSKKESKETKETKETSFCSKTDDVSVSPSVPASDSRTKEQKREALTLPRNVPSERQFNDFMEANPDECDIIAEYRPDLWGDLCRDKWHRWRNDIKKWVPIRDWKAYAMRFGEHMNNAHPRNN